MNWKELKNSGLNIPFVIILLITAGVAAYSLFDPAMSFGRAPLASKIGGVVLGFFAIAFAFKSSDWLDFIKSDNRKLLLQIVITIVLAVAALLILGVFHSGPLGTTTNPI